MTTESEICIWDFLICQYFDETSTSGWKLKWLEIDGFNRISLTNWLLLKKHLTNGIFNQTIKQLTEPVVESCNTVYGSYRVMTTA